jgi:hypothetical protein
MKTRVIQDDPEPNEDRTPDEAKAAQPRPLTNLPSEERLPLAPEPDSNGGTA